jgi:hypothetical protein
MIAVLLLAFSAVADDEVERKTDRKVIVLDGGNFAFAGDSDGWNFEGMRRGFMGISMVSLTDELREYFGVEEGLGVLVSAVVPDSPAAKAGIKAGDVILSVDGATVDGPGALGNLIRKKKDGDQIKVDVRRKGTSQQFFVTLDERDVRRFEVRVPDIELGEGHKEALDRMRVFFESPEFKHRVEKLRGDCSEYQGRLQEIETKMKELERKLEKLK